MTDIGASVIARLKARGQKDGLQLQLLLNLFCQEEFLRRIQKSQYSENLILKGGFLLYSISGFSSRPTIDADYMLKNYSNEMDEVKKMVCGIIGLHLDNDFLKFEIKSFEAIAEHREYSGVRANLIGFMKNTKTPFTVDFGAGDVIVPSAVKRSLPTLLSGFEKLEVLTYSFESTIAEKFDAILSRMELTSRMKDFFDIYYLASTYNFEGRVLQQAIFETLQNRGTPYERNLLDKIAALSENKDIMIRWYAFCKKTIKLELGLEEVLDLLVSFINPVYKAIVDERECFDVWSNVKQQWTSIKE